MPLAPLLGSVPRSGYSLGEGSRANVSGAQAGFLRPAVLGGLAGSAKTAPQSPQGPACVPCVADSSSRWTTPPFVYCASQFTVVEFIFVTVTSGT